MEPGCHGCQTTAIPPGTPAAKKSPPGGLSDATVEQKIRTKLAKSKIGADKFTVKVQGGVAYWDGKTDVIQHKGAATRMAKTARRSRRGATISRSATPPGRRRPVALPATLAPRYCETQRYLVSAGQQSAGSPKASPRHVTLKFPRHAEIPLT